MGHRISPTFLAEAATGRKPPKAVLDAIKKYDPTVELRYMETSPRGKPFQRWCLCRWVKRLATVHGVYGRHEFLEPITLLMEPDGSAMEPSMRVLDWMRAADIRDVDMAEYMSKRDQMEAKAEAKQIADRREDAKAFLLDNKRLLREFKDSIPVDTTADPKTYNSIVVDGTRDDAEGGSSA